MQNSRHDVIKFEISKTARDITGKYLSDNVWKVYQNRLIRLGCRDDTYRHTYRHTPWVFGGTSVWKKMLELSKMDFFFESLGCLDMKNAKFDVGL